MKDKIIQMCSVEDKLHVLTESGRIFYDYKWENNEPVWKEVPAPSDIDLESKEP